MAAKQNTKAAQAADKADPPAEKAAPKKDWARSLRKLGAVSEEHVDIHKSVIRTRSPSVNSTFGNGWGLPRGYSLLLGGPPKGGKSTTANDMIGACHQDYPDGIVIKINTEFKENAEMTPEAFRKWGIDKKRYICYEKNEATLFDFILDEIQPMVQDGMPLVLLVIDSVNNIQGRRAAGSDSIMDFLIGDQAQTLQDGMMRIMPFLRRHNVACVLTCHVGAEMDRAEQMRGNTHRMKVAHGLKHRIEYWAFVEPVITAAGKLDLRKQTYDDPKGFVTPKGEKEHVDARAHRIKFTMKAASFAPVGRIGEYTYNYATGIVAQEEEVFKLADLNGLIKQEGSFYSYGDKRWHGLPATLDAIRDDPKLQSAILLDLQRIDRDQKFEAGALGEALKEE